jgi:hypothetical protein
MEEAKKSKQQAADMLATWQKNGVLTEEEYSTPSRNKSTRVVLNEQKINEVLASLCGQNEC